ncbi:MAG: DUF2914 domain-containing protein [Bacteroidetes bacterium]|nr:MAG: DUF2914 domain-containing protein [Bacteroidota bacterium]
MKKLFLFFAFTFALTIIGVIFVQAQDQTGNGIEVIDAKLGTGVESRMITGEGESFAKDSQVFFWMKIAGAESREVTVTWKSGDFSHSTTLSIGGSPWRTWAFKTVHLTGDWTVSVATSDGTVLKEMGFKVE